MAFAESISTVLPPPAFASELELQLEHAAARIRPRDLAELFRFTFEPGAQATALLNTLHKFLLGWTVRRARAATAFYADPVYEERCSTAPGAPPDLSCWPVIERRDVIERFDDLLAHDVTYQSATHTSGSTGPALTIHRSAEELAFLWSYYERLLLPSARGLPSRPLILSFPNLYHGTPIRLPSIGRVFVSGVTDDTLIHDALKVLRGTYRIPGHDTRISMISGLILYVKFFTSFLLEQGIDPRQLGVTSLVIVGEYISRLGRRFLAESWGATVFERFSLTESVGGANHCLRCGHFHFDPHVIAEVVDVDTRAPLAEGIGELVLTQLYPFVQMQPLVRYATGDIVRRQRNECGVTLTFDFLGKRSNCVRWRQEGRAEWLLFSVDLYEIINEIPDIRVFDALNNVRSVCDTTVGSRQIFTQRSTPEAEAPFAIELTFELRYAPHIYPDRVTELSRRIENGLRSAVDTALGRHLEDGNGHLVLRFVGPGTLGDAHRIKI